MPKRIGPSGVYKLTNRTTGKVYIGAAARGLVVRMREHRFHLARGTCHNKHLQAAWNKYGASTFVFSVLEKCLPEQCYTREKYWVAKYNSTDPSRGYNQCAGGIGTVGFKQSEETKAKHRLFKPSPEHLAKMTKANTTREWSEAARKAMAIKSGARWNDPAYRANQIAKRVGKKASKATRLKQSRSQRGRKHTEASKEKMRQRALQVCSDPEYRAVLAARCKAMASKGGKARWAKLASMELINSGS